MNAAASAASLMAQLEELWAALDAVLARVPAPQWRGRFGREWEYADVPRHLAYFDAEVIAAGIACGAQPAPDRQVFMRTHREFNAWNARRLEASRRDDGTAEAALARMRAAREAIRRAVDSLDDAGLERPVWIALSGFAGWRTVRFALEFCRQHTWMHLTQLCLRLGHALPQLSPAITHGALDRMVRSLSPVLNRSLARRMRLNALLVLTGPGGGAWRICVADGECVIGGDPALAPADLTLTLAPATLVEVLSQMRNPFVAIAGGRIRVRGWRYMPGFFRLFPRPQLDQPLNPVS